MFKITEKHIQVANHVCSQVEQNKIQTNEELLSSVTNFCEQNSIPMDFNLDVDESGEIAIY